MNAELKAQSEEIDKVTEKTDDHRSRVAKDIKLTAQVGGKKVKKIASQAGQADAVQAAMRSAAKETKAPSSRMAALKAMQGM